MADSLRKDAALNRDRLLTAARELMEREDADLTLNAVAKHAGVGVGTAYRRFSNKEELISALYMETLEDLVAIATEAADHPDPWEGLVYFLTESLSTQFGGHGMSTILNHPCITEEQAALARDRVAPLLASLIEKAKKHGAVRADLEQSDIIFLQAGLSAIEQASRSVSPELYRRYVAIVLDGIRPGQSHPPLPVEALDANNTHRVMRKHAE